MQRKHFVSTTASPCGEITDLLTEQRRDDEVNGGNSQSVTVSQRSSALLRGLVEVVRHHGASTTIQSELVTQMSEYLDSSSDEKVWLKRAKHALTYPMAKYLRNAPPDPADQVFSPRGSLRGWMKPRLMCFNMRNTHLWYSWLQSKRCSLPASPEMVEGTYKEHLSTLTKNDCGDDSRIREIMLQPDFKDLLEEISLSVKYELGVREQSQFRQQASHNAGFEKTRSRGGQARHLGEIAGLLQRNNGRCFRWNRKIEIFVGDEELENEYWIPDFLEGGIQGGGDLHSMSDTHLFVPAGFKKYWNVLTVVECRTPSGYRQWVDELSAIKRDYTKGNLKCVIQAVLEPFKVRVISKGESLPYYLSKSLQKAIHRTIARYPCFRLIAEPFCASMLYDLQRYAQEGDKWFSVDYSAATDNLSWKYSGWIFRRVIKYLPVHVQEMALAVLGPHKLYYPPEGFGPPEYRGLQKTGQLMGSILSFPILCLANLGVYMLNMREAQNGWCLEKRLNAVLINGDDMLYPGPERLWDQHIQIGLDVGLKMSPGKSYVHDEYANVNSMSVHCSISKKATPVAVPYLNMGLFFGQRKVQVDDTKDGFRSAVEEGHVRCKVASPERVSGLYASAHLTQDPDAGYVTNIPLILAGCRDSKKCDTLARYLSLHAKAIAGECRAVLLKRKGRCKTTSLHTRNLFISKSLGGMGIEPPTGFRFMVKKTDRYLAQSLIEQDGRFFSHCLPSVGTNWMTKLDFVPAPWQNVLEDLEHPSYVYNASRMMKRSLVTKPIFFYDRDHARTLVVEIMEKGKCIGKQCLPQNDYSCLPWYEYSTPQARPAMYQDFSGTWTRPHVFFRPEDALVKTEWQADVDQTLLAFSTAFDSIGENLRMLTTGCQNRRHVAFGQTCAWCL